MFFLLKNKDMYIIYMPYHFVKKYPLYIGYHGYLLFISCGSTILLS